MIYVLNVYQLYNLYMMDILMIVTLPLKWMRVFDIKWIWEVNKAKIVLNESCFEYSKLEILHIDKRSVMEFSIYKKHPTKVMRQWIVRIPISTFDE